MFLLILKALKAYSKLYTFNRHFSKKYFHVDINIFMKDLFFIRYSLNGPSKIYINIYP